MKTDNYSAAVNFIAGRDANGSNFFSAFGAMYSYSTVIATIKNGVLLLNSRDYSNTTKRHKLHLLRAATSAGMQVFEVPICDRPTGKENEKNYLYLIEQAEETEAKADRARVYRSAYRLQAERQRQTAELYSNLFCE